jgi:hypothetical protein
MFRNLYSAAEPAFSLSPSDSSMDRIGPLFTDAYRKESLDAAQVLVDKSISQDSRVALEVGIIVRGFSIEAIPPRSDDPSRERDIADNEMTAGVINLKMLVNLGDNKTLLETKGTVHDERRHPFFRHYPKKLGRPSE